MAFREKKKKLRKKRKQREIDESGQSDNEVYCNDVEDQIELQEFDVLDCIEVWTKIQCSSQEYFRL